MDSFSKDSLKILIEDTLGELELLREDLDILDQENTNLFYNCISQFHQELVSKFYRIQKESNKTQKKESFGVPLDISKELCNFLDIPIGSKMIRTDVTKKIAKYIREHNLVDAKNSLHFHPDAKLSSLLGKPSPLRKNSTEKGYSYFNLQHYLKNHFVKRG